MTFDYWSKLNTSNPFLTPEQKKEMEAKETFSVVPMTETPSATKAVLSQTGNVPLVNNVQDDMSGLKVETSQPQAKEFVKTGESFGERMDRFYPKAKKDTFEQKRDLASQYFQGYHMNIKDMPKEKRVALQISDYKKLLGNTQDTEYREVLSSMISKLEKENQVKGAKAATTEGLTEEANAAGARGVARAIHECDVENQVELTQIVVETKDKKANMIAADNSHKTDKTVQNKTHEILFNTNDEDVQNTLVSHQGDYHKDVQKDIYKRTMTSEYQSVLENAASNIYKLHKDNQQAANQMTIDTDNEGAIKAAASQLDKCHVDNQKAMKEALANTKYESVKEEIAKQEQKAQEAKAESAKRQAETKSYEQQKADFVANFKAASPEQKVKLLASLNANQRSQAIQQIIRESQPEELRLLMLGGLKPYIMDYLQTNSSPEIMSKFSDIVGSMSDQDKNDFAKIYIGNSSKATLGAKVSMAGGLQGAFVSQVIQNGDAQYINKNYLSASAKADFMKLTRKG